MPKFINKVTNIDRYAGSSFERVRDDSKDLATGFSKPPQLVIKKMSGISRLAFVSATAIIALAISSPSQASKGLDVPESNTAQVVVASSDRFTDQVISSIKHQSMQHAAESFNQLTDVQQQEFLEINDIMHNNAEGVLKDYLAPDLYEQENHGKAVEMMNNLTPAELEQVGIDIQKLIASMPEVQDRMIMLQNSIAENGVNSIGVDGKVLPADKEAGVGATLTTTIGDNIKMTTKPMATR